MAGPSKSSQTSVSKDAPYDGAKGVERVIQKSVAAEKRIIFTFGIDFFSEGFCCVAPLPAALVC